MSVQAQFDEFNDNIKMDNTTTINLRYRAITKAVNKAFWNSESETEHSLYIGSYRRNTAIKGFSDLDITVRLPDGNWLKYYSRAGNG